MTKPQLEELIQAIVEDVVELKARHGIQEDAPVNYACIFTHSEIEYEQLQQTALQLGVVIQETNTGPLIHLKPALTTVAGNLKVLKVRKPYANRPERGDADFTITDYPKFREEVLKRSNFKLIKRDDYDMVELADPNFDVLAYFSSPPIDQQLGI